MTEEAIQRQIEAIERMGREACKSPESARAFVKELEIRTGIKLKDKKPGVKKRKNA